VFQVLLLQLNSCSVAECSSHCSRIWSLQCWTQLMS
jgi:hypothetical protein